MVRAFLIASLALGLVNWPAAASAQEVVLGTEYLDSHPKRGR